MNEAHVIIDLQVFAHNEEGVHNAAGWATRALEDLDCVRIAHTLHVGPVGGDDIQLARLHPEPESGQIARCADLAPLAAFAFGAIFGMILICLVGLRS